MITHDSIQEVAQAREHLHKVRISMAATDMDYPILHKIEVLLAGLQARATQFWGKSKEKKQ